jgi:Skp family chaperone for outer membrane proteins
MKTIIFLLTLFAAACYGQQAAAPAKPVPADVKPSVLSDAKLAKYWKAIATHHAQVAAFQSSLTATQKNLQESVDKIDKEMLDPARRDLAKDCSATERFDESGGDPVCKPVAPPPLPKAKP